MASKYFYSWYPVVFRLNINTIFHQRYCVHVLVQYLSIKSETPKYMALLCRRYKGIMSKYYWSVVVAFSMTMFVVLYYYFNEDALTDNSRNNNMNVFGNIDFDDSQIFSADNAAKFSHAKELSTKKCNSLYETASDMLYNGEQVPLPFETNSTRWTFHKRGDLDYLKTISLKWNGSFAANYKFRNFANYVNTKSKDIKAKKYFITFACNCCKKSKVKAVNSARNPGGFDFSTVHGIDSLSTKFRYAHSSILRKTRGCGYWLWKPYIILKTLIESMSDNDLLMYQDAGAHIIRDVGPLLQLAQELDPGIVVFHTQFLENVFTKRDAYVLMDMDDARVYDSYQRLASFVIVRKNCQSLQFVMEWLAYASDPRILTDIDNQMGKPSLATFKENRHDQTVLSLLSKKWQLDEFRDPSQYGNIDKNLMYTLGPYKQLLYHSRDTS